MEIGGPAVLKLLGIAPEEAEQYTFRSVVLKEKRVEPDMEALPLPILEGCGQRVYIEIQGYADKFIRYRLVSRIMLACVQDKFEDRVVAGIVYTDEAYKKSALTIKAFSDEEAGNSGDPFRKSCSRIIRKKSLWRSIRD